MRIKFCRLELNLMMMVKVLGMSQHHVEPSGGVGVHHKKRSAEVHLSLEMLVELAELSHSCPLRRAGRSDTTYKLKKMHLQLHQVTLEQQLLLLHHPATT